MKHSLVLIPCCKEKQVAANSRSSGTSPIDVRLSAFRTELREAVRTTPNLECQSANQRGWLASTPQLTPARILYNGKAYKILDDLWSTSDVHILIISAAMGVVHPDEELPEYELTMSDKLSNGEAVWKFWQRRRLAGLIHDMASRLGITHLWSLLPDSMPKFPYQQILTPRWNQGTFRCSHVKVFNESGSSAGTGTGVKRSEWLKAVVETDKGLLVRDQEMPATFTSIPGYFFTYGH